MLGDNGWCVYSCKVVLGWRSEVKMAVGLWRGVICGFVRQEMGVEMAEVKAVSGQPQWLCFQLPIPLLPSVISPTMSQPPPLLPVSPLQGSMAMPHPLLQLWHVLPPLGTLRQILNLRNGQLLDSGEFFGQKVNVRRFNQVLSTLWSAMNRNDKINSGSVSSSPNGFTLTLILNHFGLDQTKKKFYLVFISFEHYAVHFLSLQ